MEMKELILTTTADHLNDTRNCRNYIRKERCILQMCMQLN